MDYNIFFEKNKVKENVNLNIISSYNCYLKIIISKGYIDNLSRIELEIYEDETELKSISYNLKIKEKYTNFCVNFKNNIYISDYEDIGKILIFEIFVLKKNKIIYLELGPINENSKFREKLNFIKEKNQKFKTRMYSNNSKLNIIKHISIDIKSKSLILIGTNNEKVKTLNLKEFKLKNLREDTYKFKIFKQNKEYTIELTSNIEKQIITKLIENLLDNFIEIDNDDSNFSDILNSDINKNNNSLRELFVKEKKINEFQNNIIKNNILVFNKIKYNLTYFNEKINKFDLKIDLFDRNFIKFEKNNLIYKQFIKLLWFYYNKLKNFQINNNFTFFDNKMNLIIQSMHILKNEIKCKITNKNNKYINIKKLTINNIKNILIKLKSINLKPLSFDNKINYGLINIINENIHKKLNLITKDLYKKTIKNDNNKWKIFYLTIKENNIKNLNKINKFKILNDNLIKENENIKKDNNKLNIQTKKLLEKLNYYKNNYNKFQEAISDNKKEIKNIKNELNTNLYNYKNNIDDLINKIKINIDFKLDNIKIDKKQENLLIESIKNEIKVENKEEIIFKIKDIKIHNIKLINFIKNFNNNLNNLDFKKSFDSIDNKHSNIMKKLKELDNKWILKNKNNFLISNKIKTKLNEKLKIISNKIINLKSTISDIIEDNENYKNNFNNNQLNLKNYINETNNKYFKEKKKNKIISNKLNLIKDKILLVKNSIIKNKCIYLDENYRINFLKYFNKNYISKKNHSTLIKYNEKLYINNLNKINEYLASKFNIFNSLNNKVILLKNKKEKKNKYICNIEEEKNKYKKNLNEIHQKNNELRLINEKLKLEKQNYFENNKDLLNKINLLEKKTIDYKTTLINYIKWLKNKYKLDLNGKNKNIDNLNKDILNFKNWNNDMKNTILKKDLVITKLMSEVENITNFINK